MWFIDAFVDLVRIGHLFSLAVGVGSAVFLESTLAGRMRKRVDAEALALADRGHRLIFFSLAGLWATGLILAAARTGLDPAAITPKLEMKFFVVSLLTANALLISGTVRPMLATAEGRALGDLGPGCLLVIGAAAGLSAASWASALFLGAFSALKPLSGGTLTMIFAPILLSGLGLGAAAGLAISRAIDGASVAGAFGDALFPSRRAGPRPK